MEILTTDIRTMTTAIVLILSQAGEAEMHDNNFLRNRGKIVFGSFKY